MFCSVSFSGMKGPSGPPGLGGFKGDPGSLGLPGENLHLFFIYLGHKAV